ncbi:MAG: type III pantothenate kinase [Candidatus Omnitrophota bacterium]
MSTIVTIDVGNTSIHFAWVKNGRIVRTTLLPTAQSAMKSLEAVLSQDKKNTLYVCSVVPRVTALFRNLHQHVYIVGENLKVPIVSLYNKKHIGMDRLVSAYAARILYPQVRIVIDFGTAITVDFLSRTGVYEGGLILPGIGSTLRVLSSCALLPRRIILRSTQALIPRDTPQSINSGITEGFSSMVNVLVKKYKKFLCLKKNTRIVITGGDAQSILSRLDFAYSYEPFLIMKGLILLAN